LSVPVVSRQFALGDKGKHADLDKAYQQLLQYRMEDLPQFNGRLFDDADALPLDSDGMLILQRVSALN